MNKNYYKDPGINRFPHYLFLNYKLWVYVNVPSKLHLQIPLEFQEDLK